MTRVYMSCLFICSLFASEQEDTSHFWRKTAYGALTGTVQAAITIPWSYPLKCIKTSMQANSRHTKYYDGLKGIIDEGLVPSVQKTYSPITQTMQELYASGGYKRFYSGVLAGASVYTFNEALKYPLFMVVLPHYMERAFGENGKLVPGFSQKHPYIMHGLNGFTTAGLVSITTGPIKKYTVWRLTHHDQSANFVSFYKDMRGHMFEKFYGNLRPIFAKQSAALCSLLYGRELYTNMFKKHSENPKELSALQIQAVGILVGATKAACTFPFEVVETQMLRKGGLVVEGVRMYKIFPSMFYLHRQFGLLALFAGWEVQFIGQLFKGLVTVNMLEVFERWIR